jgi:hypothetical protein
MAIAGRNKLFSDQICLAAETDLRFYFSLAPQVPKSNYDKMTASAAPLIVSLLS